MSCEAILLLLCILNKEFENINLEFFQLINTMVMIFQAIFKPHSFCLKNIHCILPITLSKCVSINIWITIQFIDNNFNIICVCWIQIVYNKRNEYFC